MLIPCPKCSSSRTASIKATKCLALGAEAVNHLILRRLRAHYTAVPSSPSLEALEKLSQHLVETLAKSVQLKHQCGELYKDFTHVCLRCGHSFHLQPDAIGKTFD
jgi:hypothetical protein